MSRTTPADERWLPALLGRAAAVLGKIPGVGEKTAYRYALALATTHRAVAAELGAALTSLAAGVTDCPACGSLATVAHGAGPVCAFCRDNRRDGGLLCVVGRVQDQIAIERSGAWTGRYFVLGKLASLLDDVGADDLPLRELRAAAHDAAEVLIATPATVDGEATAMLVARELKNDGRRITRIACGVSASGDMEYADPVTLSRAIAARKPT